MNGIDDHFQHTSIMCKCALIRTWQNVGGDLHIVISALHIVHRSLRKVTDFLGGVHSESNLPLLPEKIYSSVSSSGARRLVTR